MKGMGELSMKIEQFWIFIMRHHIVKYFIIVMKDDAESIENIYYFEAH